MSNKICTICKESKDREQFYKLHQKDDINNKWDCRDSMCRLCRIIYASNRRRKIKLQVIEYLGGKCNDCGLVDDPVIYDCHHLNPSKKELAFGKVNKSFESLKKELNKCILLCANCHRKRHNTVP